MLLKCYLQNISEQVRTVKPVILFQERFQMFIWTLEMFLIFLCIYKTFLIIYCVHDKGSALTAAIY